MSAFIDFAELKRAVGIDQVLTMLGFELKRSPNGQVRGCCPIHDGSNPREFVVTPSKGLFYCFSGCGGGDMIQLVAKIRGIPPKEAAQVIANHFGNSTNPGTVPVQRNSTVTTPPPKNEKAGHTCPVLDYLQASHEAVQALGVSPATCQHFGAGYAPRGILRGRLAIPIRDRDGKLLAYCGRAVKNESPALLFPNGFDPSQVIYGADRVAGGELYLTRDPLQVLLAYENGVENAVAFLSPITAQSLEMLAALMDERKVENVEMF